LIRGRGPAQIGSVGQEIVNPFTTEEDIMSRMWIGAVMALVFALSLVAGVAGAEDKGGKGEGVKPGVAKADAKVNINEATRAQLMKLSGVGPGTADRIISYRQAHGPFRRVQDLEKVEGVGKGVIERNEGRIAVK
jgi:competence ComEA-like helix-hairpin-helix protein